MVDGLASASKLKDPILRRCLEILVQLTHPERIWLFGSRARGDNEDRSDFDLALKSSQLPETDRWRIELQLETLPTLRRFDLVWLEGAGEELRRQITKDGGASMNGLPKEPLEKWGNVLDRLMEVLARNSEDRAIIDAAIQRFEFSFELGWKAIQACLKYEGREGKTPREVLQEAFRIGGIANEQAWLAMLSDRNLTSHTYNEALADAIFCGLKKHQECMSELMTLLSSRYSAP
jgi:nucleotidyltransferase substrate binding protein (TIGR01987 family)